MMFKKDKRKSILPIILFIPIWLILLFSCDKGRSSIEPIPDEEINRGLVSIITDAHYLSGKLHDQGERYNELISGGDGKNTFIQEELFSSLLYSLRQEKPAALFVTGDLTFNGAKLSHKGLASWFGKIEALGIAVYVIPGNHDINNPWAREFQNDKAIKVDTITPSEFRSIYEDFGYSDGISYDDTSLSYLIEPLPGVQVFMLDTNKYEDNYKWGQPDTGGFIRPETRAWIREKGEAAKVEGKQVLVAMHHSLIEHNPMVSRGYTIDDSTSLVNLFSSLNIRVILSGHIHIQDIIERDTPMDRIYDIATGSLPVYPHRYGLIDLSDDEGWVYQTIPLPVEEWAIQNGKEDENLHNFNKYSAEFFTAFSGKMVTQVLEDGSYTPSEIARIAEDSGILNQNFFAGREENNNGRIDEESLEDMFHDRNSFLFQYLKSILRDSAPPDNYLIIK
ncbi:MAG: metallophosphoesterase [Spirochaetales bacterium]|nr:metallophosphoesterase [Spirochaetales bacterium]